MAQKWVAEADIDDSSRKIKYYHLKWHGGEVENFSFICRNNEKIYMFFRNEAIVIIFNMITKKAVEKNIGIGQDNIKIDCGCIWEDKVYLFSSQMKQYFRYNLTNEDKDYMGNIPFAGEVLYTICNNEYMYVLSQNTVYDVKDNFRLIVKVDDPINWLLYTGSSFSLWKVTKIIFLFHQNYFSRKKFCGYRFRLHVLLLKLSTVSINSLLRRVEFIDFCGWFLHASFLSDHFFRVIHMKK